MSKIFVAKVGALIIESDTLWDLAYTVAESQGALTVYIRGIKSTLTRADLALAAKGPEPMRATVNEQVFLVRGCPMPAKKTTSGGRFSDDQKRYHSYKDQVLAQCITQGFDQTSDIFGIECDFFWPLPLDCFRSDGSFTPKGLRLVGQPKRSKPDADNCTKPIADALRPGDDEGIWLMSGSKFWGADAVGCAVVKVRSYSFD